jgi:Flp pilus assembly protein TadG
MSKNQSERGTVVVMSAVLIPVLLFVIGLAVDFGVMYAVRNGAQNAADAAAMAGVYAYAGLDPVYTDATTAANKAALANPVFAGGTYTPTSVAAYRCTDSLGIQNYCVHVTLNVTSPVYFAKVFGKTPVPIQVQATAQANVGLGFAPQCAKPMFVPDPTLLAPPVPVGGTMTIRPTNPNGALVPSQYYSLDFTSILNPSAPKPDPVVFSDGSTSQNSGVPTYTDAWEKCVATAVRCGQKINVQTGNMGTNTDTAVQQLINSGVTTVVAPIWDPNTTVVSGNTYQATVAGFILMSNLAVIPKGSGGGVSATYVQKLSCASGGGVGSETGSYNTPIRLVQ